MIGTNEFRRTMRQVATRMAKRENKEYGMVRTARCIGLVGLLAAAVTLTGCPSGLTPGLSVTPLALNFGAGETTKTIRIQNSGGGTLTWTATVSENAPWLTLESTSTTKQANMVEGESTSEVDVLTAILNPSLLAQSSSRNATIDIASNGGMQSVSVGISEIGPAQLSVSPTTLAFGDTETELDVAISNGGSGALDWELSIPDDAPWLRASRTSNTGLSGNEVDSITFEADRDSLPGGDFQTVVSITSNGGASDILVSLSVPPLVISTDSIDFGSLLQIGSRFVNISNPSGMVAGVQFNASVQAGVSGWLALADTVQMIDPGATETIRVDANPAGLAPGIYTGTVTVASANLNFSHTIAVQMEVPGLSVSPDEIDFGQIVESQQRSFTLENLTGSELSYSIDVPQSAPWVLLSVESGSFTDTQTITVTADPSLIGAGNHEAVLDIRFGDNDSPTQTITIRMSRPEPARLEASPKSILFGTSLLERRVALWNVGIGSVDWEIDATGFPAWLSLDTVPGSTNVVLNNDVATGTVSGEDTDEVILRVDRSQAPEGQFEFSHTFTATAAGDADNTVTIELSMSIARVPVFVIEADAVDDRGISTLAIPIDEETSTFVVRNEGTGPLNWAFGELPFWITSLEPSQGTLQPNVQQTVTITISREGLSTPGIQAFLDITTNDPANESTVLDVSVTVPPVILITSDRGSLGFGAGDAVRLIGIANDGDAGTLLRYQVVTNQEWLSIAPTTGESEGTSLPIKDFQTHSVSVDRSQLDGEGASARLIVSAYLVEDGNTVPDPSVPPLEIPVTVEAAPLTIQSAQPRIRPPSLVRNLLMLRDIQSGSISIPDSRLQSVGDQFRITEAGEPLQLTETSQFLKNTYSANVLIMLDFSGSMLASAQEVLDDGQLGDPAALTESALKTVYAQGIPDMINELPDHFQIGLAVFNDRSRSEGVRVLRIPNDGEGVFTRDKGVLAARFAQLLVDDFGATDLIPAADFGSFVLANEDANNNLRPFDDADLKAVVIVSDGRDTSLQSVSELGTTVEDLGVRLFFIGWGSQVNADPMIRLATATGGHYYSTRARNTGMTDAFGVPVRVPLVDSFVDLCVLDAADECDESVPNDLASQVLLSYSSLTGLESAALELDLTFDDPNDQNSECLAEQGEISSGIAYDQVSFGEIAGDQRLGQISLVTEGIANGRATITAHADYMPRNITELSFEIIVDSLENTSLTVERVPQTRDGLIHDWEASGSDDTFTFTSPNGEPIRFGDFGDLIEISVGGVTQPFDLRIEVSEPTYDANNPETKYFTHPDGITVGGGEFLAPSFPAPFFDSDPPPVEEGNSFVVNVPDSEYDVVLEIFNLGGSHVRPGAVPNAVTGEFHRNWETDPILVGLEWSAQSASSVLTIPLLEESPLFDGEGFVTSYDDPSTMLVELDRTTVAPGTVDASINFRYSAGMNFPYEQVVNPIRIRYTVLPPVFDIDIFNEDTLQFEDLPGLFINFEATPDSQDIRITNTGQSTLNWSVDTTTLPPWVDVVASSGAVGPLEASPENFDIVTIMIIREALPLGNQFADITFTSPIADPITLEVSAEGLPPDAK